MIERPAVEQGDEPEHRGDRRRFLVWALMLGAVPPERVVERIVAEVEESGEIPQLTERKGAPHE